MHTDAIRSDFRLHDLIRRHLPRLAEHPALVEEGRTWTYAALCDASAALAAHFRSAGLRPGDRLMIVGENCVAQVAALMAASMLDAWSVIVNARLTAAEVDAIEAHCGPRLVFCTSSVSGDARRHAQARGASGHTVAGLAFDCTVANAGAVAEPVFADSAGQVAVLIYTTGTTGQPKGVMLTHRNLAFAAATSSASRSTSERDCVYAALPLSHVFGLTSVVLAALGAGATVRIAARFDVGQVVQAMADGITFFQGVPAMYVRLLAAHDGGVSIHAPQLRFIHCGGAPLDPALKTRVEALFGLPINNGYGMTEASPSICMVPYNQKCDDMTVGYVIPGVEARIVDAMGRAVPQGQVGELQIRGPNVMKGYYKAPALTAEVLSADGWLSTRDLVRQAGDGACYVMGRLKDLIIRSGFNVYPSEVEAALNAHPAVAQSCVVGKAVAGDEQVIAFVELHAGAMADADALQAFVRERLAPYKRPQRIVLVPQLPAAQSGKILKKVVLEMAARL
ncbi:class I adenylate-forming enzyme family protein [Cupriavidus oxalaticus]|uniref:AMP-binding protein n=1 Tax=Cupriavidus oxalaticus TaxID=96344 RepID=A0A5P3VJU5_9BURK|nr:class I adenylate-forming enzyme family protein [Cupriavidus oxalaticus]QEZ46228.1 AMP-binding protein [Cupriavidus oxalaticus]